MTKERMMYVGNDVDSYSLAFIYWHMKFYDILVVRKIPICKFKIRLKNKWKEQIGRITGLNFSILNYLLCFKFMLANFFREL